MMEGRLEPIVESSIAGDECHQEFGIVDLQLAELLDFAHLVSHDQAEIPQRDAGSRAARPLQRNRSGRRTARANRCPNAEKAGAGHTRRWRRGRRAVASGARPRKAAARSCRGGRKNGPALRDRRGRAGCRPSVRDALRRAGSKTRAARGRSTYVTPSGSAPVGPWLERYAVIQEYVPILGRVRVFPAVVAEAVAGIEQTVMGK